MPADASPKTSLRVFMSCFEFPYLDPEKARRTVPMRSRWNASSARSMRFFAQVHAHLRHLDLDFRVRPSGSVNR
jgi:hypothetical protein